MVVTLPGTHLEPSNSGDTAGEGFGHEWLEGLK